MVGPTPWGRATGSCVSTAANAGAGSALCCDNGAVPPCRGRRRPRLGRSRPVRGSCCGKWAWAAPGSESGGAWPREGNESGWGCASPRRADIAAAGAERWPRLGGHDGGRKRAHLDQVGGIGNRGADGAAGGAGQDLAQQANVALHVGGEEVLARLVEADAEGGVGDLAHHGGGHAARGPGRVSGPARGGCGRHTICMAQCGCAPAEKQDGDALLGGDRAARSKVTGVLGRAGLPQLQLLVGLHSNLDHIVEAGPRGWDVLGGKRGVTSRADGASSAGSRARAGHKL